jgi:hypothetical protein
MARGEEKEIEYQRERAENKRNREVRKRERV